MTTITVTAEHIANGRPGSGSDCAIALALWEIFPDAQDVAVGDYAVAFYDDKPDLSALLPDEALEFVRDFDDGQPVSPFTFELDYPAVTS